MRKYVISVFILTFCALGSVGFAQASSPSSGKSTVALLVDASGSMQGERIQGVKSAVSSILSTVKPDVKVSIIDFNQNVHVLLEPSLDRVNARAALNSITPSGETSLYDAIYSVISQRPSSGDLRIVLLSDGSDTASTIKLEPLLDQLRQVKLPVDVIGLKTSNKQDLVLMKITLASGGHFYHLDEVETLLSTYEQTLTEVMIPAVLQQKVASPKEVEPIQASLVMPASLALLITLVVFSVINIINSSYRRQRALSNNSKSLQMYRIREDLHESDGASLSIFSFHFLPSAVRNYIRQSLDLIHSELKYEVVMTQLFAGGTVLALLITLITGSIFVGIIMAALITPMLFGSFIRSKLNRQRQNFADDLPELLNILSGGLRAGLSFQQAIEVYALENKGEVGGQVRRALSEIQVGTPADIALMNIAERMDSDDLRWTVTALSIQRTVGGSMATILDTAYETVKARAQIGREVRTLSAEGRLSAYVLMALPIGIFTFLYFSRREYVEVFWTEPAGVMLLVFIVTSIISGWFWMKKVVEIAI
ncbi:unannotated protein [freshwater metagenome]|uniref:Unannotated protein n=1 Tax=freshwater metagenome TaxID=449393 RepID=A0A6J7XV31_9ZZZZ|nr:VWA domain-containing protein [Actinomycetota bacterium]